MDINKENVVQAVVIMDTFNNNFSPINKTKPMVSIRIKKGLTFSIETYICKYLL